MIDLTKALKSVMMKKFPSTKAFEGEYWIYVGKQVNEFQGTNDNIQVVGIMLVSNYIAGFLMGEGHSMEEIRSAMESLENKMKDNPEGFMEEL